MARSTFELNKRFPRAYHRSLGIGCLLACLVSGSAASAAPVLVPAGANWSYLDNGTDPGPAWRQPGFNDTSWLSGPAELGFGDGDEATLIDGGPPANRYITTYFRHGFEVQNALAHYDLTLRLLRDDGAVVYLNGAEVFRSNMPGGAIGAVTLASTTVANVNETIFVETQLDPARLIEGSNLLAVEVHQSDTTSSDLSFNLELTAQTNRFIALTAATVFWDESAGAVAMEVIRRGGLTEAMAVEYRTVDETALAGSDYVAVGGTLDFAIGQTNATVTIPILDDNSGPEAALESFRLILENPTGANLGLESAVVWIRDDDGYAELVRTNQVANEISGAFAVDLRWTGKTNMPVSVRMRSVDGSAALGPDYWVDDRVLTFAPGVTNLTQYVYVTDDTLVEGEETFFVELSEVQEGVYVGGRGRLRVAILDDDAPGWPGLGLTSHVESLAVQPDGKVLLGGWFNQVNGQWRLCVARLLPDGTLDETFVPAPGANWGVRALALQPDGRVIVGGDFNQVDTVPRNRIARLNTNGTLDPSFDPGAGANDQVLRVLPCSSGTVLIAGSFTHVDGQPRNNIARLTAAGAVDPTFDPGAGPAPAVPGTLTVITAMAEQSDGKIYVGGNFTQFSGANHQYIARLHANGSVDNTFIPWLDGGAETIEVQPDGRILVGGWFGMVNSLPRSRLVRLRPTGGVDGSFSVGAGPDAVPKNLLVQPDGKIIVAGAFSTWDGTPRAGLVRLNANGSLDPTFEVGPGATGWAFDAGLLPDQRVVAGGSFSLFNGRDAPRLVWLNADGSQDPDPVRWVRWPSSQGGNDRWYALTRNPGSWSQTEAAATNFLGHLAAVNTPEEQSFLENTFLTGPNQLRPFWIGLSDASSEGSFVWSSSDPLLFARWHLGEPNGGSLQNHVALNWDFSWSLGELGRAGLATWSDVQPAGTRFTGQADGPYFGIVETTAAPIQSTALSNLVYVRPGTFLQGDLEGEPDERPIHPVTLSRGFWIGRFEVTQWEYLSLMGTNPSVFLGNLARPVENVSWCDASNFCARLSVQERRAGRLPPGYAYRLPTEAEWEYAARAGSTTYYSFGPRDQHPLLEQYAWYDANSGGATHPVGEKLPNLWGLHDVHGNVWEWVLDWFEPYGSSQALTDPTGPAAGTWRVFKSSGYSGNLDHAHTADRSWDVPENRSSVVGFRVVLARTDGESMVWIPPGTFTMGSPPDEAGRSPNEGPQTTVTLTRGFWMSRFEVTQAEFQSLMGFNRSQFALGPDYPVEQVTWDEARDYGVGLTQRELAAGRLPPGYAYRLPTEAEWEYACRAGTTTPFSFGADLAGLNPFARHYGNSGCNPNINDCSAGATGPAGAKWPNPWGLHDLHGNVGEFVLDSLGVYPGGSVTDPQGPVGSMSNLYRGPGWDFGGIHGRSASRWPYPRGSFDNSIGFRVVLAPIAAVDQTLIATSSVWKYLDTGQDLGTVWREAAFDDSAWPSGPARLGYGGDGELTPLGYGPDPSNKIRTYYFRRALLVPEPGVYASLRLRLQRDDGAIVYLNGVEVFRSNMPPGAVDGQTLAATTVANVAERAYFQTALSPTSLRPGLNVLAVEVHQSTPDSSDLGFDLELTGVPASGPPVIHEHPRPATVPVGRDVLLRAHVSGSGPLGYQWYRDGHPLDGATTPTLDLPAAQRSDEGVYTLVVTNTLGTVTSAAALVLVGFPPSVVVPPASTNIAVGSDAAFCVETFGTPPVRYRWLRSNLAIPGASNACLSLPNVQLSQTGAYRVLITNHFGAVTSSVASLNVLLPPGIGFQPSGTNVLIGQDALFCVHPTGGGSLTFQWRKNGINIPGATNVCLGLTNVSVADGGSYRVVVANPVGAVTSDPAVLRVEAPTLQPGDQFEDRVVISGPAGVVTGTNTLATRQTAEPFHAGKPGSNSVWYAWTAPADGIVRFDTSGSAFDTLLAVYTGSALDNLEEVAADEDSGGFYTSLVQFNEFNATAGASYAIAIDGLAGASGRFALSWELDITTDVLPVISAHPQSVTEPVGGTAIFGVSVDAASGSVAYQWEFNGAPLSGETGPTLTRANLGPSEVGAYRVRVTGQGGRLAKSLEASLELGPQPGVRSVDKFEDLTAGVSASGGGGRSVLAQNNPVGAGGSVPGSQPLLLGAGSIQGSHVLSTSQALFQEKEPNHCGEITGASRWLFLQATNPGFIHLDTLGTLSPECSDFDTVLVVYTNQGSTVIGTLQPAACDNNGAPDGLRSSLVFAAQPGVLYWVALDGVNGAGGCYQLNWQFGTPPSADVASTRFLARTGTNLVLNVPAVSGWPPPNLQWMYNSYELPGETNATLTLPSLRPDQAGRYQIVVKNFAGAETNTVAVVAVTDAIDLGFVLDPQPDGIQFRVNGTISQGVVLDATSDFIFWEPVFTNDIPNQPFDFVEPQSTVAPLRFYRARPWP